MFRKNTAGQNLGFKLVKAADGTAGTLATVTVYRSIDGGAQAAATGTVAEKGNGQYNLALSQADTNGNEVSLLFVATGMIPEEKTIVTTAADPTNATTFGLANLDAAVSTRSTYAGADTAGTTTLLARLGAPAGASISADIQTRSTYAGGAVASVTAPVTAGTVTDKMGYALASGGLDPIVVEAGVNARQALSPILAACAGVLSGAGTGAIVVKAGNAPATTRITATTDGSGNRSVVNLTLPS